MIAVHGAHRFLGEINLLTGSPPYLSAVVRDAGEVVHSGSVKGVASAVGEGSMAVRLVHQRLASA